MLIQLIGPQDCGKTALRKALCPGALCIDTALRSMWNGEMMGPSPGYYFEEWDPKCKEKLEDWISHPRFAIHRKGRQLISCQNPGIWIYEGHFPIDIEPTRIWKVQRD